MEVKITKNIQQISALVGSESTEGSYYIVDIEDGVGSCTCPQFTHRGKECKHIDEVHKYLED
jgi:hypothetical protein